MKNAQQKEQRLAYRQALMAKKAVDYMFLPPDEPYCNRKVCSDCYVIKSESFRDRVRRSETEIISDIRGLVEKGYCVLPITTELLMFSRFIRILEAAESKRLLTNGAEITARPGVLGDLKMIGVRQITLTLDFGNSGMVRPDLGVAMDAWRRIENAGIEPMGRITLNKLNYMKAGEMVDACFKSGIRLLQFNRFMDLSGQGRMLKTTDAREVFEQIRLARQKYPVSKGGIYVSAAGGMGSVYREKKFECEAGKTPVAIGMDNYVYPCIYLTQEENRIGRFEGGEIIIEKTFGPPGDRLECPAYRYLAARND
jgi:MoaA/NifB/PqqE/SkfB family radical SAM enzyme